MRFHPAHIATPHLFLVYLIVLASLLFIGGALITFLSSALNRRYSGGSFGLRFTSVLPPRHA
jgi:hypothetical protein